MAIVIDKARPHIPPDPHYFSKMELAGSGKGISLTPSNTVNFPQPVKAIIAGTAGTIAVVGLDGTTTPFTVAAGQQLNVVAARINVTGTSSTGITGIV